MFLRRDLRSRVRATLFGARVAPTQGHSAVLVCSDGSRLARQEGRVL